MPGTQVAHTVQIYHAEQEWSKIMHLTCRQLFFRHQTLVTGVLLHHGVLTRLLDDPPTPACVALP